MGEALVAGAVVGAAGAAAYSASQPPRRSGPGSGAAYAQQPVVVVENGRSFPVTQNRVTVPAAPAPQFAIASVRIDTFFERANATYFYIEVTATTGERWQVEHRYSEFDALRAHLDHSFRTRTPFPGKKPVRSLFGLGDAAKDERRMELHAWLSDVVNMISKPAFHRCRRALYAFLNLPREIQVAIERQVQEVTVVASGEPQYAPVPVEPQFAPVEPLPVTAAVVDATPAPAAAPVVDATMSKAAGESAPPPVVSGTVVATNPQPTSAANPF